MGPPVRSSSPFPRTTGARPRALAGLAALACLLVCLLGSCLAPTLPLPPPEAPESIRVLDDGQWEISGQCVPGALVTAIVERTGRGSAVEDRDADGHYSVVVSADACHVVEIWQVDGTEASATTRVILQEVQGGSAIDGGACTR